MFLERNNHIDFDIIWQSICCGETFWIAKKNGMPWISITADFVGHLQDNVTGATFVASKRHQYEFVIWFQVEQMVACWGSLELFGGWCLLFFCTGRGSVDCEILASNSRIWHRVLLSVLCPSNGSKFALLQTEIEQENQVTWDAGHAAYDLAKFPCTKATSWLVGCKIDKNYISIILCILAWNGAIAETKVHIRRGRLRWDGQVKLCKVQCKL